MKISKMGMFIAALLLTASVPAAAFDFDKLRSIGENLKPLRQTSEGDEVTLGKDVAANLLGAAPLVNDPALQAYVNKVGMWIALHTSRPNLPWRFGVLDTNSVNAFATPGGYVFITRGMLMRMRDESELAGVLAHAVWTRRTSSPPTAWAWCCPRVLVMTLMVCLRLYRRFPPLIPRMMPYR